MISKLRPEDSCICITNYPDHDPTLPSNVCFSRNVCLCLCFGLKAISKLRPKDTRICISNYPDHDPTLPSNVCFLRNVCVCLCSGLKDTCISISHFIRHSGEERQWEHLHMNEAGVVEM